MLENLPGSKRTLLIQKGPHHSSSLITHWREKNPKTKHSMGRWLSHNTQGFLLQVLVNIAGSGSSLHTGTMAHFHGGHHRHEVYGLGMQLRQSSRALVIWAEWLQGE